MKLFFFFLLILSLLVLGCSQQTEVAKGPYEEPADQAKVNQTRGWNGWEAIRVCENLTEGDHCGRQTRKGWADGTCQMVKSGAGDNLMCVPSMSPRN